MDNRIVKYVHKPASEKNFLFQRPVVWPKSTKFAPDLMFWVLPELKTGLARPVERTEMLNSKRQD